MPADARAAAALLPLLCRCAAREWYALRPEFNFQSGPPQRHTGVVNVTVYDDKTHAVRRGAPALTFGFDVGKPELWRQWSFAPGPVTRSGDVLYAAIQTGTAFTAATLHRVDLRSGAHTQSPAVLYDGIFHSLHVDADGGRLLAFRDHFGGNPNVGAQILQAYDLATLAPGPLLATLPYDPYGCTYGLNSAVFDPVTRLLSQPMTKLVAGGDNTSWLVLNVTLSPPTSNTSMVHDFHPFEGNWPPQSLTLSAAGRALATYQTGYSITGDLVDFQLDLGSGAWPAGGGGQVAVTAGRMAPGTEVDTVRVAASGDGGEVLVVAGGMDENTYAPRCVTARLDAGSGKVLDFALLDDAPAAGGWSPCEGFAFVAA